MHPIKKSIYIFFCYTLLFSSNAAAMELPLDYHALRDKELATYAADPDKAMARSEKQQRRGNVAAATEALQEAFQVYLPVELWASNFQRDKERRSGGNPYPARNPEAKRQYRIEHNTRILTYTPNNTGALENRGLLYLQQNQLEKAIEDFSREIDLKEKFQRYEKQTPITVQDYLKRGEFYLLAGHEKSFASYTQALRLDPKAAEQFWAFYDHLKSSGAPYPAHQPFIYPVYKTFIRPRNNPHYLRGVTYEQKGDFPAAIADYTAAMAIDTMTNYVKPNKDAFIARSRAYEKVGDTVAAIQDLTTLIALEKQYNQPRQSYWERGMLYLRLSRLPEALDDFNAQIAQCDTASGVYNDAIYYLSRGMSYEKLGETAKAAADFARTAVLKANFYAELGDGYNKLGLYSKAHHAYKQAIRLDPAEPEHYNANGNVYLDEKDNQKAAASYLKAIAADPGFGIAYGNAGLAYANLGQNQSAFTYYQKQIDIGPANDWVYGTRAELHLANGDFPAALSDIERAIAADATSADAYYTQGKIYDRMRQTAAAKESYGRAFACDPLLELQLQTEQSPQDAKAFQALGDGYIRRNKYGKALYAYNQALRLAPNAAKIYEARGDAYMVRREFRKAAADYTQALANTEPLPDIDAFDLKGKRFDAYMESGQYKKAMADARTLGEANNWGHQHLAEIYDVLGDFDRAAAEYKKGASYGSEVFAWDYSEP